MIRVMPDSPRGYNQIAAFYIKQARRTGNSSLNIKAETAVNKALELDATNIQARKLAASLQLTFHRFAEALELAGKGKIRAMQGDLEAGVKFLTEAQNRVPNVETVVALGDIFAVQGNTEKAKQQYDLVEVIEQRLGGDQKPGGDRKRLALMWADQNINLDEALAIAESEYSARKDIYTADVYAWCLYRKGRFLEAKIAIDTALSLKTKDARLLYHAGIIEKSSAKSGKRRRC
jgi:tetratricopeptide (TPR) repeat protein